MKMLNWKQACLLLRNIGPIEFTDRYGGRTPSWLRGCFGDCEAIGYYPEDDPGLWPPGTRLAGQPEADGTPDDGWRFIKCPKCEGTGRVSWLRTLLRIPKWIYKGIKSTWNLSSDYYNDGTPKRKRIWLAFKCSFVYDILRIRN